MAVNATVLRLLDSVRITLDNHVDASTRLLVAAWASAWDELIAEWQEALEQVFGAVRDGEWPNRAQIARLDRVQRAREVTSAHLSALGEIAGVTVAGQVPGVARDALRLERELVTAQLPPVSVGIEFNRVDSHAVDAIVRRSTQRIHAASRPLAADAEAAMKRSLVRGILVGAHPATAARTMLDRTESAFNGGLQRAMVIARTELLDAHRYASRAVDMQNPRLVEGWIWVSALDARTCPSCWSMHGSSHPIDEIGPLDHVQGRCTRAPQTVSWKDLGIDIPEPPSLLGDSEATFGNLPRETQLAIMGPERLGLLDSGEVSWSDLSTRRGADGWRDSQVPTPVRDLRAMADA